jgi:hypothetical protein
MAWHGRASYLLAEIFAPRSYRNAPVIRALRKLKLTLHQQQEAIARREAGEALAEIGKSDNVSHSTISRLASQGSHLKARGRERAPALERSLARSTGDELEAPTVARPPKAGP